MKLSLKYKISVALMRGIARTWRLKIEGNQPAGIGIVVFWHGFMLPGWLAFRNKGAAAVVSLSKDGEILSHLLTKWGFTLVRGSSSSKGKETLDHIAGLASGRIILMTPDGPQGPIYKFKAGAVVAAHRSDAPIYLCGIKVGAKKIFKKSWDRFCLPLPFSRIILKYSEPIYVPKDAERDSINEIIEEIENRLNEII